MVDFPYINGSNLLGELKHLIEEDYDFPEGQIYLDGQFRLPTCGIYFLFENEDLVYIGKSTNIYSRLGAHTSAGKTCKFDRVSAIQVDKEHLAAVELAFIAAFQPKLNGSNHGGHRKLT